MGVTPELKNRMISDVSLTLDRIVCVALRSTKAESSPGVVVDFKGQLWVGLAFEQVMSFAKFEWQNGDEPAHTGTTSYASKSLGITTC